MRKRSIVLIAVTIAVIFSISLIIIMMVIGSKTISARLDRAIVNQGPPVRILHIMSYHMPWNWTEDQLEGFKHSLWGLNVEYKVYQMDTKRHNDPAWLERVGAEACALVRSLQPDLVFVSDDYAQQYVTMRFINSPIPFVFSAVNADPEVYGFVGANNITGVLEQEHFVESVLLLKRLLPKLKKVAVILDDDITWEGVVKHMKQKTDSLPDITFASWEVIHTYADFKNRVTELQGQVDALALLGIFAFKDSSAHNVPYQDVLRWIAENSKLPDFSFWEDRSLYGTLCVVSVSGFEQGLKAGEMARKILVDKVKPSSLPMEPTVKGQPIVSLRRARDLGIQIPSDVLLSSVVIETYKWEEANAP